jgi:betaine reductase
MPVLEDLLGCMAFLVGPDDDRSPRIRLDAVGRYPVSAGSTPQALMESLVVEPLSRHGLKLQDVDRFAGELHNPEVTVPAGSGDVPNKNYRLIAGIAALKGEISRDQIDAFIRERGLPGFAPTQGHIPAGVPYIGHAAQAMARGALQRTLVVAKGSLFLGRMTQLWDGLSVLLERPS